MKKIMFLALISALFVTGCKKTDSCNLTEESLVGIYRLSDLTYRNNPSGPEVDAYNNLDECRKDNLFIFNTDRSFYYQDAGNVCLFSGSMNSTWSLIGTTLTFDNTVNNVADFDCSGMTTTYTDSQGGIITAKYARQ